MNSYATHPWPEKGLKAHEDEPQYDRDTVRSNGITFHNRTGESKRFSPNERDIQGSGVSNSHFRSSR